MKVLAVGILIQNGRVLVVKRSAQNSYGGLWEFPNAEVKSGDSEENVLVNEFKEHLGLAVKVEECIVKSNYQENGREMVFETYLVNSEQAYVPTDSNPETRLVSKEELKLLDFKGEDIDIINKLYGYF